METPEFQTFFTPERLEQFWYFVKWFLFLVAPMLMIFVALTGVEGLVKVIRGTFSSKDDDDDDYDVYRY